MNCLAPLELSAFLYDGARYDQVLSHVIEDGCAGCARAMADLALTEPSPERRRLLLRRLEALGLIPAGCDQPTAGVRLVAWLGRASTLAGLPEELRAHASRCAACARELAAFDALERALLGPADSRAEAAAARPLEGAQPVAACSPRELAAFLERGEHFDRVVGHVTEDECEPCRAWLAERASREVDPVRRALYVRRLLAHGISLAHVVSVGRETAPDDRAPRAALDVPTGADAGDAREVCFSDGSTAVLRLREADAPGDVTASFERIDVGPGCGAAFIVMRGRGAEVYAARVADGHARLDVPSAALEPGQRTVYLVKRPSVGHDAGATHAELRPRDTLLALRRDKPAGQGREIGAQLVVGEASIELALSGRGEWYTAPLPHRSGIDLAALGPKVRVGEEALDAFVLDNVLYVASPRWAIGAWRPQGVKVLCRSCREWRLAAPDVLPAEGAAAREPVIALFDCACGTRNALIVCHDDLGLDAPTLWGEDPARARAVIEAFRTARALGRAVAGPELSALVREVARRERDQRERGADVRIERRRRLYTGRPQVLRDGSFPTRRSAQTADSVLPGEPADGGQAARLEDAFLGVVICHACGEASPVDGEQGYVGRDRPEWADEEPYLLPHACPSCQAETFALVGPADLGDRGVRLRGVAADTARAQVAELRRLKTLSPRALAGLLRSFVRRAAALGDDERALLEQIADFGGSYDDRGDDLERRTLVVGLLLRYQKQV